MEKGIEVMSVRRHLHRAIVAGFAAATAGLLAGSGAPARAGEAQVSFNRDVRPILSEHCFACHGPDPGSRKAGLRLDLRTGATATSRAGRSPSSPASPTRASSTGD